VFLHKFYHFIIAPFKSYMETTAWVLADASITL